MHDAIADFETDLQGLARSSRAVNKLAKAVSRCSLPIDNLIIYIYFGRCI